MDRDFPPDSEERYWQVELERQREAAGTAAKRRRWILLMGTLFHLPSPMVSILAFRGGPAFWLLLVPFFTGAMIAFFGMTMTDHRRNTGEWGLEMPSWCLFWAAAIVVLVVLFLNPSAALVLGFATIPAWLFTFAGGWITAVIVERLVGPKP
jgi:hypothetical protein